MQVNYHTLRPFVPSGPDFAKAKSFFLALGFEISWEVEGLIGFQKDTCEFILQELDHEELANNLMLQMQVDDLDTFWVELQALDLLSTFNCKLKAPYDYPWGREVHLIDLAGVCWHFRS